MDALPIEIIAKIVNYLQPYALLPAALTCHCFLDATRRVLGPHQLLKSNEKHFVSSVSMVEWAIRMRCRTTNLCNTSASLGCTRVLRWLREENTPPFPWNRVTICDEAVKAGCLSSLKWLIEEKGIKSYDARTSAIAAGSGHLHILIYLRYQLDPPCTWDVLTCTRAAESGHLSILKWLRECNSPPCPWGESTCNRAAIEGHLDILRWLRQECSPPCPWNEPLCFFYIGYHMRTPSNQVVYLSENYVFLLTTYMQKQGVVTGVRRY